MSRLVRIRRQAIHLKNLHHSHFKTLSFLSSFSTSASESAPTDSESTPARYTPPPVGVALTENAGRAVFASRRIVAGELIHTAKPLVSHPSFSLIHSVCYFCLRRLPKPDSSSEASQTVSFCCKQCEEQSKKFYNVEKKADWSRFNEYCRLQGLKYPLLAKRFTCHVISGFIPFNILDILQPERSSSDKISMMKEEFALLKSILEDSDIEREKMSFLTEEWYTGVLARLRINAFRIELPVGSYENLLSSAAASVEAEAAVGNAIYVLPSFYNHDCVYVVVVYWQQETHKLQKELVLKSNSVENVENTSCSHWPMSFLQRAAIQTVMWQVNERELLSLIADPNVNIFWSENVDAEIKALRDIEEEEELRICYIDASMGYEARQKLLYEGFGFRCNCSRCVSKD